MTRIRLTLAYDGSAYAGWQVQPEGATIQGAIEAVLATMEGRTVRVTGSGRTDAGVHAEAQVAHFDTTLTLNDEKWVRALNAQLPRDIVVLDAARVPDGFHARHGSDGKHYRYRLLTRDVPCPFRRAYCWWVPVPLDLAAMRRAAETLAGEHDFSSFRASGCAARSPVRTVTRLEIVADGDELRFEVEGNGFLKQMVRNLVGTLVEVGRGARRADTMADLIAARDRTRAGETAPAWGLTLVAVRYPA